jgi:hypothetical protein
MPQPGRISRILLAVLWFLLGLAMVAVPVWVGWTSWSAVLNGHPALLVATIACGLIGAIALAWSVASLVIGDREDQLIDDDRPARRTPKQLRRRARRRIGLAVPSLVLSVLLVVAVGYARPLGAAPVATNALHSTATMRLTERFGWYEMAPVTQDKTGKEIKPTTGLIFAPGARVDARAYAHILQPLVAAGYLVAVLKEPFGFSLVEPNHAATVIGVHPEIAHWAVGGHSLGGVAASSFADKTPQVTGLVLYASYPAQRLSRTDLKVLSVSGSADGLATPAKVDAAKADLPANTTYVVVDGGVHSYFGDYGEQPGDGQPTTDRAAAQATIGKATVALLASLTPPPPPPKKKKR